MNIDPKFDVFKKFTLLSARLRVLDEQSLLLFEAADDSF